MNKDSCISWLNINILNTWKLHFCCCLPGKWLLIAKDAISSHFSIVICLLVIQRLYNFQPSSISYNLDGCLILGRCSVLLNNYNHQIFAILFHNRLGGCRLWSAKCTLQMCALFHVCLLIRHRLDLFIISFVHEARTTVCSYSCTQPTKEREQSTHTRSLMKRKIEIKMQTKFSC